MIASLLLPAASWIRRSTSLATIAAALALAGCDAGYGYQGTVTHTDASLAGHVLVVSVYPESSLGADGLPVPSEDEPPRLALMKRVDGTESKFEWSKLGCNASVRVLAWVDVDDSERFAEDLPPGTQLDSFDDDELAEKAAAARPGAGDWRAVSDATDFDQSFLCDPGSVTVTLDLAPAL